VIPAKKGGVRIAFHALLSPRGKGKNDRFNYQSAPIALKRKAKEVVDDKPSDAGTALFLGGSTAL
jgi:hypothetical protein